MGRISQNKLVFDGKTIDSVSCTSLAKVPAYVMDWGQMVYVGHGYFEDHSFPYHVSRLET